MPEEVAGKEVFTPYRTILLIVIYTSVKESITLRKDSGNILVGLSSYDHTVLYTFTIHKCERDSYYVPSIHPYQLHSCRTY